MGAGIARAISFAFRESSTPEQLQLARQGSLGQFSRWELPDGRRGYNMFTQPEPGQFRLATAWAGAALGRVLLDMDAWEGRPRRSLGLPLVGCGIAGGMPESFFCELMMAARTFTPYSGPDIDIKLVVPDDELRRRVMLERLRIPL
jgi:hypothetical protein